MELQSFAQKQFRNQLHIHVTNPCIFVSLPYICFILHGTCKIYMVYIYIYICSIHRSIMGSLFFSTPWSITKTRAILFRPTRAHHLPFRWAWNQTAGKYLSNEKKPWLVRVYKLAVSPTRWQWNNNLFIFYEGTPDLNFTESTVSGPGIPSIYKGLYYLVIWGFFHKPWHRDPFFNNQDSIYPLEV